ncbi:site-specific integrase [Streptomyces olivoreticuli]|uniref:site-specific integrase n=1 Tax=Streptomyces olivoreticuli TaxID=68246 RepID=UPI0026585D96|nr:site-specific integrase [Streptomyces olivoreticuli]WKK26900.1 site-specific integrase [Streptomyces olivoreticuli]
MNGTTTKRCYCRSEETGKPLGTACPKFKQRTHGVWSLRQELPPNKDGERRVFRRAGYDTKTDAQTDLDKVRALLNITEKEDKEGRRRLGDMLETVGASKDPIPDYDETKRKFSTGQSLTQHMTVGEWLELWLAGKKGLRTSGKNRYDTDLRVHLIPRVGHIRLDRLTVQHLDEMFAGIAETNIEINDANILRRTALDELKLIPWKGLENRRRRKAIKETIDAMPPFRRITGVATQHHIKATLRAALNTAIARGLIIFNAAQHVELEAARRPKALVWTDERIAEWLRTGIKPSAVMVWTPEQAGQFLDFLADTGERLYALFHLITFRGLRRGETCGVRRTDRARAAGTLTIATQLVQDGWEVVENAPKTDAGERVIELDEYTDEVLDDQALRQDAERLAYGEAWIDSGRMFTMPDGSFIHPGWLTDHFERLVELSGLPPIRLHDLRHVAASLMLAAGVDIKIVSETLGHSESRITRDIYQSVMPKAAREAAEATAAIVPRGAARRAEQTPAEAATADPRVEQVAQMAIDHLVAQIFAAAGEGGRTVEEITQTALAHLAGQAADAVANQDGHATGTQNGAKIIEFRPRRVPA